MRQDYAAGAANAVRVCFNIERRDRVAIIKDDDCAEIAEAVEEEVRSTGAELISWRMEDHVRRPASEFPNALAAEIVAFSPTAWTGNLMD